MKFLAVSCIVALACGVAGEAPGETSGTAKEPPIGVAVCGGGMRAMTEGMAIARGIGPENWPRVTHLGASGGYWFGTQFVSRCGLAPRAASRARRVGAPMLPILPLQNLVEDRKQTTKRDGEVDRAHPGGQRVRDDPKHRDVRDLERFSLDVWMARLVKHSQ